MKWKYPISTEDHLDDIDYLAGRAHRMFKEEGAGSDWLSDVKDIQTKCSILLSRDFLERAEARRKEA